MHVHDGRLSTSPTDLANFLACRHRTALELSVAHGVRTRPIWKDPLRELLFKLGEEHERDYVETLKKTSSQVIDLKAETDPAVVIARTVEAMRAGVDVIVQAGLSRGRWYGRPDVLKRVDRPSPILSAWSYEPLDTKLARETRGGTILQLGLYCELLEEAQGVAPECFHVVSPEAHHSYRFHDYAAYFRLIKSKFEAEAERGHEVLEAENYPEPVDHCDICPWIHECEKRRRDDDHLSLVANISRLQRRELTARGILTVESLAALDDPFPFKPDRGAVETYERVRDQARVQVRSRAEGQIVYELVRPDGGRVFRPGEPVEIVGLARLPEPSPGDVFLDLEGDPLATEGGREYLFGLVTVEGEEVRYRAWWADDAACERRAFEEVVDFITARLETHPGLHVYHYAPYEPSAFKRLMGRYATREREIDQLLRGRRFIDLYAVVRQGIRAGVERYSIKNLEPIYGFERAVALSDANRALRVMEQALEFGQMSLATPDIREVVQGYNQDDCVSTLRLRDWLEAGRAELEARIGAPIPRPIAPPMDARPELDDKAKAVEALRARLLDLGGGVPDDPSARTPAQQASYQIAYLLDWHRREDKAEWWEYYRLCELPEEDLLEEPKAVAGLRYVGDIERVKKSVVQRYAYPEQEIEIRPSDELKNQAGAKFAEVVAVDYDANTIDMLVGPSKVNERPTALFAHKHFDKKEMEQSLFDLGARVAECGSAECGAPGVAECGAPGVAECGAPGLQTRGATLLPPCPERALLLHETPRLKSGTFNPPDNGVTEYAVSIVTELDRTVLAIQGPPGSGKTYTGAQMILAAINAGLKVGVTANSHKVIRNLLEAVRDAWSPGSLDPGNEPVRDLWSPGSSDPGNELRIGHRCSKEDEESGTDGLAVFRDNATALAALGDGAVNVLGGTAWLWARPEFKESVDLLFVDEAGQMALANVLGVSRAAKSVVLLGDPRQLEQPIKGSHPDGVGLSTLQHILGEEQTMPRERGLFLPVTWRLPPSICGFTSELFYEGKLESKPGLERQVLKSTVAGELQPSGNFAGSGLWLIEVEHQGNRSASDEEAAEVARIVERLLAPGSIWIDEKGAERQLTPADIRIVAPFNAHVHRIREAFRRTEGAADGGRVFRPGESDGVPVGTVDKFQGQQAPVVIYSMATSRPEDAPRGMEFLYSLNRLNVATSRAQCACVVVCSPRLLEPECRTPRQMQLANGLARYGEMATPHSKKVSLRYTYPDRHV